MSIKRIRINHLASPSGVTGNPIFSWVNEGFIQNEYRITVSTSTSLLWDSGIVRSDKHNAIEYKGNPLPSLEKCTLTIIANDKRETATFVTGCPELGEKAKWIHDKEVRRYNLKTYVVTGNLGGGMEDGAKGYAEAVYLQKEFSLKKSIKEAYLAICGLGFYHIEINGLNIGSALLQPAQTDYNKRALYNVFETGDFLRKGLNTCRITLGNGRLIQPYGYDGEPKTIMLLRIRYTDGSKEDIITDESFLASSGPITRNSIYEGTVYDARKKLHFERRHHASVIPGYPLEPEMLPPIIETETLKPVEIKLLENGNWLVDFGQNSSGIYRIRMKGKRGESIRMHFSELADDNGLNTETSRDANTEDVYISDGRERIYQPRFTYHGFRYMEIAGYNDILRKEDIGKIVLHTNLEPTGNFICSDSLLTRIHENIRWSQRSNSMGIPTDCPQREERMGWLGDVQLVSRQAVLDFDMAAFYKKFLDDIRLSQLEDGELSDVTPPYWRLYPADPVWGSAYATLLWRMYEEYGDEPALAAHYQSLRKYLDWLFSQVTEDGTIHGLGKYGDWCAPTMTYPKKTSTDFTSSWFLLKDTLVFSRIAEVLGKTADHAKYMDRFDYLKKSFLARFDDNGKFAFATASPSDTLSNTTSQILPLALNIVPENEKEEAVEQLKRCIRKRYDWHIDCGIVGLRYLFDVLLNNGLDEACYKIMTQKTYPGFGYMIECGATTLWERWEYLAGIGMNSHNHIMYGSPNAWFYQGLSGIRRTSKKKEWIIHPFFPEKMSYAYASCMTEAGSISVFWKKNGKKAKLIIRLPLEYSACFIPPVGWGTVNQQLGGKEEYSLTLSCKQ